MTELMKAVGAKGKSRKAKRTAKRAGVKLVTIAIIFFGLMTIIEQVFAQVGLVGVTSTVIAMAAFNTGIIAERYVF